MSANLVLLASTCVDGTCPSVYDTHTNDVVVQGHVEVMTTPDGEAAVRLPRALLLEAVRKLSEQKRSSARI